MPRLGDLLHFGQLFQACGNNQFAQIAHNFCKGVKIFNFSHEIVFGQLYGYLATFFLVTLEKTHSSFKIDVIANDNSYQRTLTIGGSVTVWLISSFISLDLTASLHTNNHIFFWSNRVLLNCRPAVH